MKNLVTNRCPNSSELEAINFQKMADDLSIMLFWFADCSSFYSVLTIICGFIVMVVFILRLNNENIFMNLNASSVQQVNHAVEKCVTDIINPFSVQMMPNTLSSLKDGIHIQLSLLKSCILQVYWGIDLEEFHKAMQAPWQHILNNLHTQSWLQGYTLFHNENKRLNPCKSRHEHLQCPGEMSHSVLGDPPRKKYPAIVITYLPAYQEDETTSNPIIVAVFSVIHLKDSICQQDSHIVNQYLKTSNQGVFSLQPLFVSTSPECDRTASQSPGNSSSGTSSGDRQSNGVQESGQNVQVSIAQDERPTTSHKASAGTAMADTSESTRDKDHTNICTKCKQETCLENCEFCSEINMAGKAVNECSNSTTDDLHIDSDHCRSRHDTRDTLLSPETEQNLITTEEQWEECIVCQVERVAFALLPCRHACVCKSCFAQLDRCPMCRGYIASYFQIRQGSDSESLTQGVDTPSDSTGSPHHEGLWERLNSRLNTYFGFS